MHRLRQHKETEKKIHQSLYTNLVLLTSFYPTTKEFDAIFHRDMFVKNNKVAFCEVIYYLLNSLNPELTKQKLTSWPIYEAKGEAKFRSEVRSYINELNQLYENADIPICQASTLIAPGGVRFTKFMLKVSQFVLYSHLKKVSQCSPLYNPKPTKNLPIVTVATKNMFKKVTELIESETDELLKSFNTYREEMDIKAAQIIKDFTEVNKNIENAKIELIKMQNEFNLKYPSYPSLASLEEKIDTLNNQVKNILEIKELFTTNETMLQNITSLKLTLEHNENNFSVPTEISHIITDKKVLNLAEYFRGVLMILKRKSLELQEPTKTHIEENIIDIDSLSLKYQKLLNQFEYQEKQLEKILDDLVDLFNEAKNSNSLLAVPLPQ